MEEGEYEKIMKLTNDYDSSKEMSFEDIIELIGEIGLIFSMPFKAEWRWNAVFIGHSGSIQADSIILLFEKMMDWIKYNPPCPYCYKNNIFNNKCFSCGKKIKQWPISKLSYKVEILKFNKK